MAVGAGVLWGQGAAVPEPDVWGDAGSGGAATFPGGQAWGHESGARHEKERVIAAML